MKFSSVWRTNTLLIVVASLLWANAPQQAIAARSKIYATLDLNKATEAQLEAVPGIGTVYAKKIISGRPYNSVDDLSKAGLPDATIRKIRSRVSVAGERSPVKSGKPGTAATKTPLLDLNKATEAQLEDLPGIGMASAKKIIAGRPYKSVEDLSKAGLPAATISNIRSHVNVNGYASPTKVSKVTRSDEADTKPVPLNAPLNLNKASAAQLEEVPGIGPAYAKKIIAGRPYKSVDDLSKAGLPAATISNIRKLVIVAEPVPHTVAKPIIPDATTARPDLNKATQSQLEEVSGIGEVYAKKIIAGRPYKSVDDVSKAGIPASTIAKIKSLVTVGGSTASPSKDMVWVNLNTKVYHTEGSRWYGNTKSGKYMSEADAIKGGYKASKE